MRGRVESSIKCAIGSVALSELCIVADVLLYWMGYLILLYEKNRYWYIGAIVNEFTWLLVLYVNIFNE